MGVKNLAPNAIRSPDRLAHSESLYRLSYLGPTVTFIPLLIQFQILTINFPTTLCHLLAASHDILHEEVTVFNWLIGLSSSDDWSSLYECDFLKVILVKEVGFEPGIL